jgi:hypothetical protein
MEQPLSSQRNPPLKGYNQQEGIDYSNFRDLCTTCKDEYNQNSAFLSSTIQVASSPDGCEVHLSLGRLDRRGLHGEATGVYRKREGAFNVPSEESFVRVKIHKN